MRYENILPAVFLDRPNRFIAHVDINGHCETAHVKNTGRCKELLVSGAEVYLTASNSPNRKTKYDLVAVRKSNGLLINMDSQAPNKVAREWLDKQGYDVVIPEYSYGASRMDFYMEKGTESFLMEVKGCTLEVDGIGYFPDAPTQQGTKHLRELTKAVVQGYRAQIAFVIQMDGITQVNPNNAIDPAFALAMDEAKAAGVEVLFLLCHVEPDSLTVIDEIKEVI